MYSLQVENLLGYIFHTVEEIMLQMMTLNFFFVVSPKYIFGWLWSSYEENILENLEIILLLSEIGTSRKMRLKYFSFQYMLYFNRTANDYSIKEITSVVV